MQLPPRLLLIHLAGALGGAERTSALLLSYLQKTQIASVTTLGSALLEPVLGPYCDRYIDGSKLELELWFTDWTRLRRDTDRVASIIQETAPNLVLGMMHYGATLAVLGGRRSGCKLRTIASLRGPVYEHMLRYETNFRRHLFLRTIVAITGRFANQVVVPSAGTGAELVRRFWVPARRITVIPNGIDLQAVQIAMQDPAPDFPPLPSNQPVLCAVARLAVEKDLELLLDAFALVYKSYPATLLIVGDGPDRAALEAKTKVLGLENAVHFIGYRANVFPYLARADIFIHTCQFEGFGYTMLEAMACGIPVVATDCPYGPREVVEAGISGLLARPGDPYALAQAILRLLEDPSLRHKLALGAKDRAQVLSVERMMCSYGSVLNQLAASLH